VQAAEFNFRNQLKTVKKKEFSMDEEEGAAVIFGMVISYQEKLPLFHESLKTTCRLFLLNSDQRPGDIKYVSKQIICQICSKSST
jgi:hypothetical protein